MSTVETRKNERGTTYRARVRLDGHPPVTRSFPNKAAARGWAAEVEAEMRNGRYASGSGRTLAEAVARYTATRLLELRDQDTTLVHLGWWVAHCGKVRLRDLSVMMVADAMDILATQRVKPRKPGGAAGPRRPATLNRYKATLSAVLKWCQRRGWITGNPARHVAARVEANERVRFLSPEERLGLLAACAISDTKALLPAVMTLLATGGRLMEVMSLRWSDVDLNYGSITIRRSKNGDARRVPLTAETTTMLANWRDCDPWRRPPTGLLFPAAKCPARPADLRRSWHSALKKAGITNFRRHDLRHSAASALASGGASLLTIGAILGHRSPAATQRYAHLAENDLRHALERAETTQRIS